MDSLLRDWHEQKDPIAEIFRVLGSLHREKKPVKAVLVDRIYVALGFTFVVEHSGNWYYLINENDFERLLANIPSRTSESLSNSLWGVPVVRDRQLVKEVMCGIFFGSLRLSHY